MNVELFDSDQRLVLVVAIGVSLLVFVGLRLLRRAQAWQVAAASIATVAGFVLVVERAVDWVVGATDAGAGQFNEYAWVLLSPWGRVGLAVGLGAAITTVGLTWIGSRRHGSLWRRATLVGLRSGAVLAALALFLEPAIELRQVAREPNRIAVIVDDSMSMSLSDGDIDGATRVDRARSVIEQSAATLEAWRRDHLVDFFSFSDALVQSSEDRIAASDPVGKSTLIRQALEQARARYDGAELAGMVVVSDGIANGGFSEMGMGEFEEFVAALDAPVHTVWVGDDGLRDVSIAAVRADEFAFVRTATRIEATVDATGYERRRIPITLASDGQPMRRKWIEIGPGTTRSRVVFEFTPAKVGKYVYEISTPVDDSEAVETNNRRRFVVRVIRDKIRVLQVAGQPSWDVRSLRGMLKQNPNVDLISFFILRTADDLNKAPTSELSLIPFPTRELFQEQLPSFDLVILQNFDFLPYDIGRYLESLRTYVESGGGLMMLGGPLSFASGRYAETPVAEALPVRLPDFMTASKDLIDTKMFSPRLTEIGEIHPVTALRYETPDNLAAWHALPELEGINVVLGARKGAAVLAVHPQLKTRSGEPMPLIVAGDYGHGRSLAITTDSLWRWGFVAAEQPGDDGRHYLKFWDNAIRWLIQDPELRYLHVSSDRVEYEPGVPVRLGIRLLDQDYTPLPDHEVKLKVVEGSDPGTTKKIATASVTVGEAGEGSYELSELEAGVYRVSASAMVRSREVSASDIFLVRESSRELLEPAATDEILKRIASASGGVHLADVGSLPEGLPFVAPKVVRVDRRQDVELWAGPWLLIVALLFLGLEWGLRQRTARR